MCGACGGQNCFMSSYYYPVDYYSNNLTPKELRN